MKKMKLLTNLGDIISNNNSNDHCGAWVYMAESYWAQKFSIRSLGNGFRTEPGG